MKDTIKGMKKTRQNGRKYFHDVFSSKDGIQNTMNCLNSAGRKQVVQLEKGSPRYFVEEQCVSEISM